MMNMFLLLLASTAWAAEAPVDPVLSARSDVIVIRVSSATAVACDKYCWPTVTVVKVIRNQSKQVFAKGRKMKIAHLSSSHALPSGEFTVYLEKYGKGSNLLKVLGGKTEIGVKDAAPVVVPR